MKVFQLASLLQEHGHEVRVLVAQATPSLLPEDIDWRILVESPIGQPGTSARPFHNTRSNLWRHWLQEEYQRYRPDIVHVQDLSDAWALASIAAVPMVWSVRTDPQRSKQLYRETISFADGLEVWNPTGLQWLQSLPQCTPLIQWNCSGITQPNHRSFKWSGNPAIVCVARIDENKNQTALLNALPLILQSKPEAMLHFVGDGDLRATVQQQCITLGVENHCVFHGYRPDAADIITSADIAVLLSQREGFAATLMEAMIAKVACVSSQGAAGVIEGGRLGWIVADNEPHSIATTVVNALTDTHRDQIINDAYITASTAYTQQAALQRTLQLYQQVLTINPHRSYRDRQQMALALASNCE